MEETTARGQVSRRTIAKGMAWAAPAIPVVAMAPKAAASVCVPTLSFSGDSCRCPGSGQNDKDYFVKICNLGTTCPDADGILYVQIRANTGQNPPLYAPAIAVPVGGCSELVHFLSSNSASKLRLYYGATAAIATDPDNPLFLEVNAPNDCGTATPQLGTCPADETTAPIQDAETEPTQKLAAESEVAEEPAAETEVAEEPAAETEVAEEPAVETEPTP